MDSTYTIQNRVKETRKLTMHRVHEYSLNINCIAWIYAKMKVQLWPQSHLTSSFL